MRALLLASPAPVEVVPAHDGTGSEPDLVLEESGTYHEVTRKSGEPKDQGPGCHRLSALPSPCSSQHPERERPVSRKPRAMSTTPSTTTPVVLATDGTMASDGALHYAVQQARTRRADLRILHVMPMAVPMPPLRPVEPADLEPYALDVLTHAAEQARDLAPGLAVSTMLAHGGRVRAIVDGSADAQLVVVGRESTHGLERLLTGATTAGVAANARCPVVVVPGDWRPRSNAEAGGTVVVGIRRPDDASHLMAAAYEQATMLDATITVVHAWELPDPYLDRIEARTQPDEWQALGAAAARRGAGRLARPVPPPVDRDPGGPRPRCERPRGRREGGRPAGRAPGPRAPSVRPPRGHRAGRPAHSPAPVEVVPAHVGGVAR